MAHKMYITDAIVCGSRNRNTSDRSFLLFTREAGMVWAAARSVREERSKQRHALQDFSHIRVSLVRGKSGWRIGSVEALQNYFLNAEDRKIRGIVSGVVHLLRRFVHGEEVHVQLYDDTVAILQSSQLGHNESLLDVYTLRVMAQLGYIAPHKEYNSLLTQSDWYTKPVPVPAIATQAITRGLESSHL